MQNMNKIYKKPVDPQQPDLAMLANKGKKRTIANKLICLVEQFLALLARCPDET